MRNLKKILDHNKKFHMEHWQVINVYLFLYDMFIVNLAYFLALWIRFDCHYSEIPQKYLYAWMVFIPFYTLFCAFVFVLLKLYKSIWRFASYVELQRIMQASIATTVFHVLFITFVIKRMPITYYAFGAIIQFFGIAGVRFAYRFVLMVRGDHNSNNSYVKRVMIIGAGSAGQMLSRDIRRADSENQRVVCFIDDNPNKWNRYIDGIKIAGSRGDIPSVVQNYQIDSIYLAIPSLSRSEQAKILNICKDTGCKIRNLPGMMQLARGDVHVSDLKEVEIEDLLGRDQIQVNLNEIFRELADMYITSG